MINSDPLSFLDEPTESEASNVNENDPLSFLDSPKKKVSKNNVDSKNDVLSFLDIPEKVEEPEEEYVSPKDEKGNYPDDMSYWERAKHYFKGDEFGKANVLQMQSGGPSGFPSTSPKQAAKVGTEVATLAAMEAAFVPIIGAAAASTYIPNILTSFARLTYGFSTGAAMTTTGKLVEEGELPTVDEVMEGGATWMAIDALLHAGTAVGQTGWEFGSAIRKIAKEEGVSSAKVLNDLWKSTKNYIKSKFNRSVETPADITKGDVEILVDKVKQLEDQSVGKRDIEIDVTPKKDKVEPSEIGFEEKKQIEYKPEMGKEFEEVPFKDLNVRSRDLKIAEENLNKNKPSVTPNEPVEVSYNIDTGEKTLEDGYHRYLAARGGTIKKAVTTNTDGSIKAKIEYVKNEKTQYGTETRPATKKEIEEFKINKEKPKGKSVEESDWQYTREDFPTKKEAQDYLDHLNMSLKKVPPSHKPNLERDIKNLEELVAGFKESPKQKKLLPESKINEIKRQDITPQGLKTQKQYILEEVKNALISPQEGEKVVIDVPGDGVFKINNNSEALTKFGKEVEKKWPEKKLPIPQKQNVRVQKLTPQELDEMRVKEEPKPSKVTTLKSEIQEETPELQAKPTQATPKSTRPLRPVKGKKQAVARSKIIKLFRKAFNDPIRIGKIAQRRAAGIHKLWPKVTRLLKDNDIETVAHEIGHNLHTTLYGGNAANPKDQFKNIERALNPYLNELQPLAHYAPWGMEGFAEFTRLYVTNPTVAQSLAPNFYKKFEADLEAQYPEMKNALLEARDYYDKWIHGTPQSRIRVHTSYASDKGKLENLIESLKENFNLDKIKTQWLDDVFPAKRLVSEAFDIPLSEVENLKDPRNLYRSLRVLKGAVGKGDVFLLHETFNAKTLDKINGSLKDILKQLKNEEDYRSFNDYLIARRSIEKAQQKIDTGIQLGDAIDVEKDLRGKYGQLALELDKYNDTLLRYAVDSGLLSAEQYNTTKQNNLLYTPFQRVMEKEKGGAASGGGSVQASNPIKRMRGGKGDIVAPIESIIKNTYAIIINSEKNLAGQVLAKLSQTKDTLGQYVEALPTPIKLKGSVEGDQVARELAKEFEAAGLVDLVEYDAAGKVKLRQDIEDAIPDIFLRFGAGKYPAGENIITVFEKGKPKYYQVSKEIYEMWNKGTSPYAANLAVKILRIPARTLRAGAILNPKFMLKNIVRDTWGSWLFTKYGKSVKDPVGLFIDTLYSPLAMLSVSAKQAPLYVEWLKSGGGMSTMQSMDRDNIVKKLDEIRGNSKFSVLKVLRQTAEISEEANRLVEFGNALAVEGKTRLGREIAAFAARDLSIDFAKMGLQVKAINQICTFFNATLQGGDKYIRTLWNPKDRKSFIARNVAFIILPSLWLWWLNKDDEDIKEMQDQEKDFNFITKIHGSYLKIPVPFEAGVISHGMTQRMADYFMKKDPEAFEGFMGSVKDAMMPNLLPTAGLPFIETWANKSFFTGSRIIPRSQEDLISKYQYKNSSSSTARVIGRAIGYMLGQDTRSKAASPAIIDHFINSWTGGLGQLIRKVTDASLEAAGLAEKIEGPTRSTTEKLGLDAFEIRFPRAYTKSIEKFYDNYSDAIARHTSYSRAEKQELDTSEEIEAGYERVEKIYDIATLKKAYKAISECQKEINGIWNDPTIDSDLKKTFIDELYLQMIDFARAANEEIKAHRLAG